MVKSDAKILRSDFQTPSWLRFPLLKLDELLMSLCLRRHDAKIVEIIKILEINSYSTMDH